MLWDCRSCDTKKLLGVTHRFCPNCGGPQDPAWRYFPSDEEKIAVKDHVYHGADVVCSGCDVPNSRAAKHCVACGAELGKARDAKQRTDVTLGEGQKFAGETAKDAKADHNAQREARNNPAPPPKPKPKLSKGAKIALGAVATLIVLILVAVLWKKEAAVVVTGHNWTRSIAIEKFGPKSESAWCNEMPRDAYSVSRSREVRDHKKVPDGETCSTRKKDKGDGTFSEVKECKTKYREEPVYDDKCRYRVDRWQHDRDVVAKGGSVAETPAWPTVPVLRAGTCLGCEREGPRQQQYNVALEIVGKEKKTSSCGFDEAKWRSLAVGSKWKMKFGVLTGLPDCGSMLPQ